MALSPSVAEHVSAADIASRLTWDDLVTSQRDVFRAYAQGEAELATRALLAYGENTAFSYLARASRDGWPVVKIGSVNPSNPGRGLASVHALVLVMDKVTGEVVATMDGEAITTRRTPAASIAAMEGLAGDVTGTAWTRHVVIVGAGRQGLAHADLVLARYPDARVTLVTRPGSSAVVTGIDGAAVDERLHVTDDLRGAVQEADAVILCTTSFEPVLPAEWLNSGTLLISVGSFAANRHEFGVDVIERAGSVFVDDADTACMQCGPVAAAISSRQLARADVHSIGDVFVGRVAPPAAASDLTVYASVGLGIQDAAVVDRLMGEQSHG